METGTRLGIHNYINQGITRTAYLLTFFYTKLFGKVSEWFPSILILLMLMAPTAMHFMNRDLKSNRTIAFAEFSFTGLASWWILDLKKPEGGYPALVWVYMLTNWIPPWILTAITYNIHSLITHCRQLRSVSSTTNEIPDAQPLSQFSKSNIESVPVEDLRIITVPGPSDGSTHAAFIGSPIQDIEMRV